MNELLDHDDSLLSRGDRELTLGTGTILGIFFGLVVLCGACFGGGYFMGRKSQPTPLTIADSSPDAITGSSTAKPPAGSPFDASGSSASASPTVTVAPVAVPRPAPVVRRPPPPPVTASESAGEPPAAKVAEPVKTPAVKPVAPSALLPTASPAAAATPGFIMVQVAAVSHQEDADLLLGALRARGYAVMARKGSGDPLIHVQVGPFNNKPAAEAMRQKLMGDGYNAMLKF